MTDPDLTLLDVPGEQGRTTVTLLAALAARLAALAAVSGSDAIGSLTAGYAELGRRAAATAEGARMLAAIRASRAGDNGEALWRELGIDRWASSLPPADVLAQFLGDVALLAADDLPQALALPRAPAEPHGPGDAPRPGPVEFPDYLLGMWSFARSVTLAVEALVGDEVAGQPAVVPSGAPPSNHRTGPLLR